MLLFLTGVIEQLDLALEHTVKGDIHNARFALMLTDNALELVLHQIAKDNQHDANGWRYREKPYPHQKQLSAAFKGGFSEKITFAGLAAGLDKGTARTFNIMHDYRNEVYHAGLAHEEILPALARFYLSAACDYIGRYDPHGLGWGSGFKMPQRAAKYFQGDQFIPGSKEQFTNACKTIATESGHDAALLVDVIADHLDHIVNYMDIYIKIVADGVYEGQQTTRDKAVLQTQAWGIAFEETGKALAQEIGWSGSVGGWVDYLAENYPFKYKIDPIPGWQKQAVNLRRKPDPHAALDHYQSFMIETVKLRAALEQSAAAAEHEIEAATDRMRGN